MKTKTTKDNATLNDVAGAGLQPVTHNKMTEGDNLTGGYYECCSTCSALRHVEL